jgi:hypothetical protein
VSAADDVLFGAAIALTAAARPAFLAAQCAGDAPQLARLTAMLAAYEAADAHAFMATALLPPRRAAEAPGDRIGRYHLLEKIGEGGWGVVFRAEQREPVRREVALKIIKLGMDTAAVVTRFEAERQALARMEHPGIARVLDAGATDAGRPFFVMELVRGVRITEFCTREKLPLPARLRVFLQVCRAVHHAHQQGIIHRDLKPSNLLVAFHDGAPVVKVIDFGIAKATQGRLADATLFTAADHVIGTPAYMSPEQAESGITDLDTRSDVYALGVVLFELLTARLPFGATASTANPADVRRAIRERAAPRPSHHDPHVARDLDHIVLKCLEMDRARRYDSAAALAEDLGRFLAHEPVTAVAPSPAYVFGKLVRRHRVAFAVGGSILFLLVGGLGLSTWLFLRERATLERARASEQKTVEAFRAALRQQALANQARATATDPAALVANPATRAQVLDALADFHAGRGESAKAEALRAEARALRPDRR